MFSTVNPFQMFKAGSVNLTVALGISSMVWQAGDRQRPPNFIYHDCLQLLYRLHTCRCFLRFDIKTVDVKCIFSAGKHIFHCTVMFEPFHDF